MSDTDPRTAPPALLSVLIVDDSPVNRTLVQASLRTEGYRVLQAPDGLSGLGIAQREKPDLIIIDLMMPDMNGAELIERLRREPFEPRPYLLIYTALDEHEARQMAAEIGADGFLSKPCLPTLLRARVRELLAARTNGAAPERGFRAQPLPPA